MTIKKSSFFGVITVGAILIITSTGLITANAQTTTTNSSSSTSSQVGNTDKPANPLHQEIKKALDNKDYEAWKAASAKTSRGSEIVKIIDTQAKFDRLLVGYNAMKSGDKATAKAIRKELRLPTKPEGHKNRKNPEREAVQIAINNSDYEAWKIAVANSPKGTKLLSTINTEAKFQKFLEMHKAMKSGDKTTAESIRAELGLGDHSKAGGRSDNDK